jgi:hypothetical protein
METITEHVADFALGFMDFRCLSGLCYVHETSYDGASYITVFPLAPQCAVLTMETPVRVVTVIDGESLGGDDYATLRAALIDLHGASEGESLPSILR